MLDVDVGVLAKYPLHTCLEHRFLLSKGLMSKLPAISAWHVSLAGKHEVGVNKQLQISGYELRT